MADTYLQSLFNVSRWPVLLLILALLACELIAFRRTSLKYHDVSALVFLSTITLCLLSKSVVLFLKADIQPETESGIEFPPLDMATMFFDMTYWLLLNFFVIEMKTVHDYLETKEKEEFQARLKSTRYLRNIVLPLQMVMSVIFRILVCLKIFKVPFY